jgi:hypothetical protein
MTMELYKRKMAEQWINQAQRQVQTAQVHLSQCRYPESVQSSQQCCELSLKAIFAFLEIGYPREHGLSRQELARIANELRNRNLLEKLVDRGNLNLDLPRLLFLVNFWAEFYLIAKYGIQDGYLASAEDLLKDKEAKLAEEHASECWLAASLIRSLSDDRLAAILE